jgi:signal transduction histidine kinase
MSGAGLPQSEKMSALIHLAGEVAHELNNIFTAVTGNLSLLSEQIHSEAPPVEMIEEITRTAQRGIALSQKLQAFAGRQPLKRRPVDVMEVLAAFENDLTDRLPAGIRLVRGPAPQSCISYVDAEMLRSTLHELAANAVAAMHGNGTLHFSVAERALGGQNALGLHSGSYVRIRVTDSGGGMEPTALARAADPLFSTKAPDINAGWGLSNCAGFMRQSGGCMQLRSAAGSGTVVELYLPLGAPASGQAARASAR